MADVVSRTVETDVYLKVECRRDGRGEVRSAAVTGMTQKPPRAGVGSISVRVRLRVPVSVFGPYVPEAIVVLPEPPTDAVQVVMAEPVVVVHEPVGDAPHAWCSGCGGTWPCRSVGA